VSETLVTVVRYEEYDNTKLLDSLTLAFEIKGTVNEIAKYYIDSVENKIKRMIKKINFCYHDGISLSYSYGTARTGEHQYDVMLKINYNYEKSPNFYKLDVQGLLPCIPEYDKQQFQYALIHGMEPTLNMVKLVNI